MKFKKRIAAVTMMLSLVVSCVLGVSAFAVPTYTAINGSNNACELKKYLIFDSTNCPTANFSFSISGPTVESTDGSATGTPTITSSASFNSNSTSYSSAQTGDDITLSSGEKYAKQDLTVDLSGVSFSEPGIYRFTITESGTNAGVTNDSNSTLYLDVYITDNNGTLTDSAYVVHSDSTVHTSDATISSKPDGFKNRYTSNELTISKTVTGNQGSKDKFFKYVISMSNLAPSGVYAVDLTDATGTVPVGAATDDTYEGASNPTSITADASGDATATFYLSHDESIVINGLPDGVTYTVTETKEDYTASVAVSSTGTVAGATGAASQDATTCATAQETIDGDDTVAYTNNRAGTIPTGIIVHFLPYALAFMVVASGLIVMLAAKKRNAMR